MGLLLRIDLGPEYGGVLATRATRALIPLASTIAIDAFEAGDPSILCSDLTALRTAAANLMMWPAAGRA